MPGRESVVSAHIIGTIKVLIVVERNVTEAELGTAVKFQAHYLAATESRSAVLPRVAVPPTPGRYTNIVPEGSSARTAAMSSLYLLPVLGLLDKIKRPP